MSTPVRFLWAVFAAVASLNTTAFAATELGSGKQKARQDFFCITADASVSLWNVEAGGAVVVAVREDKPFATAYMQRVESKRGECFSGEAMQVCVYSDSPRITESPEGKNVYSGQFSVKDATFNLGCVDYRVREK